MRQRISPGRISIDNWIDVIQTAHEVGIPTTSTIMYGHIENARHRAIHLSVLRDIQKRTGGITEFVPLSFVYEEAPMSHRKALRRAAPWRQRRRSDEDVRRVALHAQQLDSQFAGVVGQGRAEAVADRLLAGANDFGGTLINESISTAAGAGYGQLMKPSEFRSLIRQMSRIPAERSTTYQKVRVFETEDNHRDLLDEINDPSQRFGSYQNLIHLKDYRFRDFYKEQRSEKHT